MPIIKYTADAMFAELPEKTPAKSPVGEIVAMGAGKSLFHPGSKAGTGVWHSTPGVFHRTSLRAEFCHILEGEAVFTAEGGEPVPFKAGDSIFIADGTAGTWDVKSYIRKTYVVFDDVGCA